MRFTQGLVLALATTATASSWFSKAAYNKWHETELERWLSDHDVPYPTPADRKDLENLVKSNWNDKIANPASESVESTSDAMGNVKDYVFDSWTDSQLKAYLDKHGVPAPQPRKRDSLLKTARENYESVAKKLNEYSGYPGSWLYETWSESDLKEFLDARGYPVPQPSTRDKLIASVRRNARLSSLNMQNAASSASASAASAQATLSEQLFDAWSDSQLKEFFDKHGIKVPQGSKRNEMVALARKHSASLGDYATSVTDSAASAFGAATSSAGNQYAKATDDAQLKGDDAFDSAVNSWSDSRLKEFLDARGIPAPQGGKRDELLAKVRLNRHKVASGFNAWTFDDFSTANLKAYLEKQGKKASGSRDQLLKSAQNQLSSASASGGSNYASATGYLAKTTDSVKSTAFDNWSDAELKKYLDSYGISNPQGSKIEQLKAEARKQSTYFKYGTSSPSGTVFARVQDSFNWLLDQVKLGAGAGRAKGQEAADQAASSAASATASVKNEL